MRHVAHPVICFVATLLITAPACAQETKESSGKVMPRVSVVHPGASALRTDLKAILMLTSEKEQKEWVNINDFIEQFVGGVNQEKPLRVDILVDRSDLPTLLSIPVEDMEMFRENIYILGVEASRDRRDKNLYKLSDSYEGFMRFINGYASIASEKNDVAAIVLGDRTADISDLLKRNYSVGAEIVNSMLDEESRGQRRMKFADIRESLMSAIKKTPKETKAAFELRRALVDTQMDEAERLLADTQRLTAGWKLADDAKGGTFSFDLKPIAETDLAKSAMAFGKSPSMFANVTRSDDAILSLRVNHPLDEMRIRNLNRIWSLSEPDSHERLDKTELSDEEKTSAKELTSHLFTLLKQGTDGGVLDSFVEVTQDESGKHAMVTGLKVPAECDLMKLIELIPKAHKQQKLETNVDKFGETDIHKLTVTSRYSDEFKSFFGDDAVVWIGTSKTGFWSAVGVGSKEKLKTAIEQAGAEATDEVVGPAIDLVMHLKPLIDLHSRLEAKLPLPKGETEKTRRQERRELRRKALEAMQPTDDLIKFRMSRVEDRVEGTTEVGTGIMRLVGKLMAEFSKVNLSLE